VAKTTTAFNSKAVVSQHLSGWGEKHHKNPVMTADLWLENRTREFPKCELMRNVNYVIDPFRSG
jgi:hypothetical protein